ncbi:MAG TPA: 3-methyladenine DNA glycosylase [Opitutaceae bacterium]|nr:3-methyladenine DNA glycosylase [Opitutaceae bacterium]
MTTLFAPQTLAESDWLEQVERHEQRLRPRLDPHQERAARGEKHPVWDFLFSYYGFRPAWLRQWHPGPDVVLLGVEARRFLRWSQYHHTDEGVSLDLNRIPEKRRAFAAWLHGFLESVEQRPAFFGCHGLHEWAMVYRQSPEQVRHTAWPLRLSAEEIAAQVERGPLACTHYDAFRFFTPPASPLNRHTLTREGVTSFEQRGCLHANMDLYKWACKLAPYTPSELLAECFELACDIRAVDMRASPYDLQELGFAPIQIEKPEGRFEYERHQRAFASRSLPLRARLKALCVRLAPN